MLCNLGKLQLAIISNVHNSCSQMLCCFAFVITPAKPQLKEKKKHIDGSVWQREASKARRLLPTYSWGEIQCKLHFIYIQSISVEDGGQRIKYTADIYEFALYGYSDYWLGGHRSPTETCYALNILGISNGTEFLYLSKRVGPKKFKLFQQSPILQ